MRAKLTLVAILSYCVVFSQVANRYDVVIDEIMTDPAPSAGLPDFEFIELKNTSTRSFNLNGWRIGDATGFATINTNFILLPDSFVIICSSGAATALAAFGTTLSVSNFPSLDNNGEQVSLRSAEGRIIHAIEYNINWYNNIVKNQGGWTLEMIDTRNACSGASNWTASTDLKGGTPGKRNAVDGRNTDRQPPVLLRAFATDNTTVTLVFDEPLDSASAIAVNKYTINNNIGQPLSVSVTPPLFNSIRLKTPIPLQQNKVYDIMVDGVTDCSANQVGGYNKAKLGLATMPDTMDLVVNEILFNPRPDGVDYIELYNRSNRIINLKDCYIASRNATGNISAPWQLTPDNHLLFPQEYIVITEATAVVQQQYLATEPAAFIEVGTLPSYPDDKGAVVILNVQGAILDELQYNAQWHFKLINNDEGVALERIDYGKPTQDANNWHSAATSAGYGTPGYRNSQLRLADTSGGTINIVPAVFSPDNDGFDDIATITYRFPQQGYVCNIIIFDANGRPVRQLTHNALCGINGFFSWDGLDEKNARLPIGTYIVYTEIFNLQGKTQKFKQAVTLLRRL
jgi:hypothetical protein